MQKDIKHLKTVFDDLENRIKASRGIPEGVDRRLNNVKRTINELDDYIPVIPKFVAEWIVEAKGRDLTIYGAMNQVPNRVEMWFIEKSKEHQELFVKAWLYSYEILEPKYRLKFQGGYISDFEVSKHRDPDDPWEKFSSAKSRPMRVGIDITIREDARIFTESELDKVKEYLKVEVEEI